MKRYVFDSYAIIAFLENEPGAHIVEKALSEITTQKAKGFLSVINWGEIYYTVMREKGKAVAEKVVQHIANYNLTFIEADLPLTKVAARLKDRYHIAYADCFAAALAKQQDASVLTGDPEFKQLEKEVHIIWLLD